MGHTGTLTRGYGSVGPALATLTSPEQPARLVALSQAPAPLRRPAPAHSRGPARIPAPRPVPGVVPLAVRPGVPCPRGLDAPRTAFVPPPAPAGLAPVRPLVQHPLPPEGGPMTGVVRAVRRALPDARLPRPARPAVGWGPQATTGRVLLAAVAVGAAMPALQALDTHEAEAEPTTSTQVARTDLALAAQRGPAAASSASTATTSAISAVTTVSTPVADPSAGDATDMAALTKAIGVARENGPLEFGRPYTAGNDRNLDGQIAKALGLLGLPQKLAPGVKKIIMRESTGNPDAINNWDSNASAGTPSKGLMQLIDVSFRNSVLPSLAGKGIYDPVANITAGVRFMIANHGIDTLMDGGLRNAAGNYIGYGGSKVPDDGLGLATRP